MYRSVFIRFNVFLFTLTVTDSGENTASYLKQVILCLDGLL